MCGIVGFIGNTKSGTVAKRIITGLNRLKYRGYDNAGLVIGNGVVAYRYRVVGDATTLEEKLMNIPAEEKEGIMGIGHDRWAQVGEKENLENAHPIASEDEQLYIVHNGTIDNHHALDVKLRNVGIKMRGETDTERLVNLIQYIHKELGNVDLVDTLPDVLKLVTGAYAFVLMGSLVGNRLIACTYGKKLIIGRTKEGHMVASDQQPLVGFAETYAEIGTHQIAIIKANSITIAKWNGKDSKLKSVKPVIKDITISLEEIEKGNFEHFMLKEIYEQPHTLAASTLPRLRADKKKEIVRLGGIERILDKLINAEHITFVGMGTSYNAGLYASLLVRQLAGIRSSAEVASELSSQDMPMNDKDVIIGISQSGETADTIDAITHVQEIIRTKELKAVTASVVNVVESEIARLTGVGIYTHAGKEIGVASTKAYTAQLGVLVLLAIELAYHRNRLTYDEVRSYCDEFEQLPTLVEKALKTSNGIAETLAKKYADAPSMLYLGRWIEYPTALEGALKMKEISYIPSEGHPASQLKHGPIALVKKRMPSVFVAPKNKEHKNILTTMGEVKTRNGPIIAVATEGDALVEQLAGDGNVFWVSPVHELLAPIVNIIPLQVLAYKVAKERGCAIDQPRNLSKSVTVK
jgi:glutamine---fructose-6-phosphate transaminase (isomerizing)